VLYIDSKNWNLNCILILFLFCTLNFFSQSSTNFSPNTIPGLRLWLTGDSVYINNSGQVDTCYDLSSVKNHAIQPINADQPLSLFSPKLGHRILKFDGQNDFMYFQNISDVRTIFWVLKEDSDAISFVKPIMGHSSNYDFFRGSNKEFWHPTNTSSSIRNGVLRLNKTDTTGITAKIPNEFCVVSLLTTGNVTTEYISNDRNFAGRFWDGDFAEIIIYNTPLTNSQIDSVENYLLNKYATPINLGSDQILINNFCNINLDAGPNKINYQWSTGEQTQSITVTQSGTYWVSAKDLFGRTTSDTVNISITRPSFNQVADTVVCAQNFTWNTNLNKSIFNFIWSDGTLDSLIQVSSSGNYHVKITDTLGCSFQSDTVHLTIDNFAQNSTLGPDTSFCGTHPIYINNINNPGISYTWNDLSNNDSLQINSTGNYWVEALNSNGCILKDSIYIVVNPIPVFDLGNDTTVCYKDTLTLQTNLSNCTFQWSNNSSGSILNVVDPGNYWLKSTNGFGCIYNDTIKIEIDTTFKYSTLGNDTGLCSGNEIFLYNTFSSSGLTYLWSDGSNNSTLSVQNPGIYWIKATNTKNCIIKDTISITINGVAPNVSFSSGNICFGVPIQILNLSTPAPGDTIIEYFWELGDGSTDTLINVSHLYADTGSYLINLTVTSNTGCKNSVNNTIQVFPNPISNFYVSGNLCRNTLTAFNDSTINSGYPINGYQWNFNDPSSGINNISNQQNPGHSFSTHGQFAVELSISDINGCSDSITKITNILQEPSADFNTGLTCQFGTVNFTDSSNFYGLQAQKYYWNFSGVEGDSLSAVNYVYTDTGTFTVKHVIQSTNGCYDTISKSVKINPKPTANFSYSGTCVNDTLFLMDSSFVTGGLINIWNWKIGNQNVSNSSQYQLMNVSIDTIDVTLEIESIDGCKDTVSKSIYIYPLPQPTFDFNPTEGVAPLDVFFNNQTTGNNTFVWDFGDSVQSTLINPIHQYSDTGLFQISLLATSSYGCKSKYTDQILVYYPRLDVSAIGFDLQTTGNFTKITGQFKNEGTIEINHLELYARIADGSYIKEDWNGVLPKGGVLSYQFSSSPYLTGSEDYLCIEAKNPNLNSDQNLNNNLYCNSIRLNILDVFDLFPNPTQDVINIPINFNGKDQLEIFLYDSEGKILNNISYQNQETGLKFFSFNLKNLSEGLYFIKTRFKDKEFIKKFIKTNSQ
jgi:PKD repeat protein